MIWLRLSPHDRRVVTRGALFVAAVVGLTRGVPAWRSWVGEERASAFELAGDVASIETTIPRQRALEESLRVRTATRAGIDSLLLAGDSPSAAAASLAARVSVAATEASVRLGSVQVQGDSVTAQTIYTRVWVRADAVGDVSGLLAMLVALESDSARLRVRKLSITQPGPAAPATQPEALHIDLVVDALARVPTTARPEAP